VSGRRLPALVVLVALVAVGALVDRNVGHPRAVAVTASAPMPVATPASALSSTWYCTGGTAAPQRGADALVVLANTGSRARSGTVTFFPNQGGSKGVPVRVEPASRAVVGAQSAVRAPWVSALVELDGGEVVAELSVAGPLGPSIAPCASAASPRWYFAEGVTTKDATEMLLLFNPFPEDAIVDLSFSTEEGRSEPQGLQGLTVPGRSTTAVNVGDFVHRRTAVSTAIVTRIGRMVVARLQSFDGTAGRKGQSLTLGAPAPAPLWYFPEGFLAPGVTERYQLFNPSDREVKASLAPTLEQGAAEPIDVTIPPQARVTVTTNEENRIPRLVAHAVTLRAEGGAAVVAERVIDAVPPAGRAGFAATMGSTATAKRWAFASGAADATWDEWVVVQNPGLRPARLSVTALAAGQRLAVDGLQDRVLAPGQRTAFRLGEHIQRPDLPLVVTGSQPVVVERDLYLAKGLGSTMSMGLLLP
jgi:uncharacterized protein DUF5719